MMIDVPGRTRRLLEVDGIVQGVGFRPFVHGLAVEHGLGGLVRNHGGTVWVEIEGETASLDAFGVALLARAPRASRIEHVGTREVPAIGEQEFRIETSVLVDGLASIAPDIATCETCLRELADPRDRRHRHPFITCTDCGPRMTIVTGAPYDRARTTMSGFAMCEHCRAEYEDTRGRRYHAQPIACHACGPRLRMIDGSDGVDADPIAFTANAIRAGRIVAIKGVGGYHLACRADDDAVVRTLRQRKERDDKPFAVMVPDLAACDRIAHVDDDERAMLVCAAAPIVLVRRRADAAIASSVAPESEHLGVMLPYTPVHRLLLDALELAIVLTSGNRSDEPMAFDDDDARVQLAGIADVFLVHDRPIATRADDSVMRVIRGSPAFLRRSRGYAPTSIRLPMSLPRPTIAVGGHDKNVFAIGVGDRAFLSPHVGDLGHANAARAFRETLDRFERMLGVRAEQLVVDAHPDFESTLYAEQRAGDEGLRIVRVQHHRAHFAACLADAGHAGPALGVCFDGTGLGDDGTVWGGEIFVGDAANMERVAHLETVCLPGGDRAAREGWRMAVAYAVASELDVERCVPRIDASMRDAVAALVKSDPRATITSSAGRLFDAIASLVGARDRSSYDGQAACALEALAAASDDEGVYPFRIRSGTPLRIDLRATIRALVGDAASPRDRARRFHRTLATAVVEACVRLARTHDVEHVALSGGCFQNAVFTSDVLAGLADHDLIALRHRQVPPNDGGLCLGQLFLAARMHA
jgi:hydrogenase maturation protein HypF